MNICISVQIYLPSCTFPGKRKKSFDYRPAKIDLLNK